MNFDDEFLFVVTMAEEPTTQQAGGPKDADESQRFSPRGSRALKFAGLLGALSVAQSLFIGRMPFHLGVAIVAFVGVSAIGFAIAYVVFSLSKRASWVIIILILIPLIYLGAGFYRGLAGSWPGNEPRESIVMLDQFMGMKDFPVRCVILESRAGYIKMKWSDGRVVEHSGNYTVVTR